MTSSLSPLYYQAQCVLTDPTGTSGVTGTVFIRESRVGTGSVTVTGTVAGLTAGSHGFHVHADSDIADLCTGAGGHFNPSDVDHAGPDDTLRHKGDWGNIVANSNGDAILNYSYSGVSLEDLTGNIMGRAIVVHAGEDDLGTGGDDGSLATGNAGGRDACCIITELDNSALPSGARCNGSTKLPGDSRPKCASGLCCGTATEQDSEDPDKVEICEPEVATTTSIAASGTYNTATTSSVYDFECIEGGIKLVSSVSAFVASAYMMA